VGILLVTAVEAEAEAIGEIPGARVIVAGLGRTNAAAATTEALLAGVSRPIVLSVGVAGALPGSDLAIGEAVAASACVYAEEGLAGPDGFHDVTAIGFPLGDFVGNAVPVDQRVLGALGGIFRSAPIATVATCSGTDAAAAEVVRRTAACAEAMEGAAVVHAARRLGAPAGELRVISNTTGNRPDQHWDLRAALAALRPTVVTAVEALLGMPE
jgi:futalosine hydrolase